jgi:hypothetical protein
LQLLDPSSSNPAGSSTFFSLLDPASGAGSSAADPQIINFQIIAREMHKVYIAALLGSLMLIVSDLPFCLTRGICYSPSLHHTTYPLNLFLLISRKFSATDGKELLRFLKDHLPKMICFCKNM